MKFYLECCRLLVLISFLIKGKPMARKRIQIPQAFITESWQLVKRHKNMYWLLLSNLVVTSILLIVMLAALILPIFDLSQAHGAVAAVLVKVIIVVFAYLLIPLTANIFNGAIILYANGIMTKQPITLLQALSQSIKKIGVLTQWTLVQSTIGIILRLIDTIAHNALAELVINLILGAAWGLISFFALPFMLLDNQNAISAIKSSVTTVKNIWGQRAIIRLGSLSLIFLLLSLAGIGLIVLGIKLQDQWSLMMIVVAIVFLVAVAYTRTLLLAVIKVKLYLAVKAGEYK